MIYRSNLTCPDLSPYFKLKSPAIQNHGHDVPSDPDFEPGCGFWTHDEAAIIFQVAKQVAGAWLDLGSRFGWTGAHLNEAGCRVTLCDRAYQDFDYYKRARFNRVLLGCEWSDHTTQETLEYIATKEPGRLFDGFVIDADHDEPQPLLDAQGCHRIAKADAVILMHDFWGRPIQDGVRWLMENGWQCRIYNTPNGVALLWRGLEQDCQSGGFMPPHHVPDPAINWTEIRSRVTDFPWEKTE